MKAGKRFVCVILGVFVFAAFSAQAQDAFEQASESAEIAGHALSKVHRWLHEVALTKIDPETGLYKADGKWNYRDTAADCYPFLLWAAFVVDEEALNGPVREILDREQALCNTYGRIPVSWDFEKGAPAKDIEWDEVVFQASEYVKDGLIAMVEVTGPDEWFDRMRGIEDDLWATAKVETPFGKIPSTNVEVNGEQLQALAPIFPRKISSPRACATTAARSSGDWDSSMPSKPRTVRPRRPNTRRASSRSTMKFSSAAALKTV